MTLHITLNVQRKTVMENCVEESGRILSERVIDHNGRDKNFHIFKNSVEREHRASTLHEFSILRGDYRKYKFPRKDA